MPVKSRRCSHELNPAVQMKPLKGRRRRAAEDPIFDRYRGAFAAAREGGPSFLERGTHEFGRDHGGGENAPVSYPRAAVYTGAGASHSWIWTADLLERLGLFDVSFIDEVSFAAMGLSRFDILAVGGGDTYAMADRLGREGAAALESRNRAGGFLYFGSCAGAYLVLGGIDLEPFTAFRLIEGEMLNVMDDPPPPRCLEHKYLAGYGDGWVFHPVYGEVGLAPGAAAKGFPCFNGSKQVRAPLFGGPVMRAAGGDEVLAEYAELTDRAAYLWPREDARGLVIGAAAVLLADTGAGTVLVSGPHLEHPLFPPANAMAAEVFLRHCAYRLERRWEPPPDRFTGAVDTTQNGAARAVLEIKRQVSNARVVGFGLERMPVTWRMGLKVWEPEKIRMFLDSAWARLPFIEDRAGRIRHGEQLDSLAGGYGRVTDAARSLKIKIESGEDSEKEALSLLLTLKELTASFLSFYFRLRLEDRVG